MRGDHLGALCNLGKLLRTRRQGDRLRMNAGLQAQAPRFGRYRRYFGRAAGTTALPWDLLERLGGAMAFNDCADSVGEVPAGYTYLGQFIFHDLSWMAPGPTPCEPINQRSAALDLESLFASGSPASLACGATTDGQPCDIPRTAVGVPLIADTRNDSNLALAQTHVALLRFFDAVSRVTDAQPEAKRLTQLHFQSVVLHDYASRVIDDEVYRDVMEHGRAVIHTDGEDFLVPLEFAGACARFGHSMVRNSYSWSAMHPGAHLHAFWDNTYNSAVQPITRLTSHWTADWRRLLGVEVGSAEPTIFAARIGTTLAFPLKNIRPQALPPGTRAVSNLAVRTLQSGHSLELSGAQHVHVQVIDRLRRCGRPEFDPLSEQELLDGESAEVRQVLRERSPAGPAPIECTPLWFYVLKEALVRNQGSKLGPLGSRIVMETLHAAVEAAEPSILRSSDRSGWSTDPRLRPSSPPRYSFADLVRFSGLAD